MKFRLSEISNGFSSGIVYLFSLVRVKEKAEKIVLLSLLAYFLFLCFSFLMFSGYDRNFPSIMGYDTFYYLGDYTADQTWHISKIFNWNLRHPLLCLLNAPLLLVGLIFDQFGIDTRIWLFMPTYAAIMSVNGLLLFKILRKLGCTLAISVCLLAFFCSFAYVVLMSVVVDSFVLTMFFTLLLVLVVLHGRSDAYVDNLLFVGLAGATSTSSLKMLAACLFAGNGIKKGVSRFFRSIWLFVGLLLITGGWLVYQLFVVKGLGLDDIFFGSGTGVKYAVMENTLVFVKSASVGEKLHLFWSNFLSEPMLFHHSCGLFYNSDANVMIPYPGYIYNAVIAAVYLVVAASAVWNFREVAMRLFLSFFAIDVLIHFVAGYGLDELQLFCVHWYFFIPIAISLVCRRVARRKVVSRILCAGICSCTVFFLIHNLSCFFNSL